MSLVHASSYPILIYEYRVLRWYTFNALFYTNYVNIDVRYDAKKYMEPSETSFWVFTLYKTTVAHMIVHHTYPIGVI